MIHPRFKTDIDPTTKQNNDISFVIEQFVKLPAGEEIFKICAKNSLANIGSNEKVATSVKY
jgi:hypothetical protein